jgi:flagellar biosynthetic protein FliQ
MNTYQEIAKQALALILLLSLPPLITSVVVGVLISLLQALTQVQEQTLTFVPKILATVIVIIVFAGWTFQKMIIFTQQVYNFIPYVGNAK